MRRIIFLLLLLTLVLGLCVTDCAAESVEVELIMGQNIVSIVRGSVNEFSFTAPATGTYEFSAYKPFTYLKIYDDNNDLLNKGDASGRTSFTVSLMKENHITIKVSFSVTADYVINVTGNLEPESAPTLSTGKNTCSLSSDGANIYRFEPAAAGKYKFSSTSYKLGFIIYDQTMVEIGDSEDNEDGCSATVELLADRPYYIKLFSSGDDSVPLKIKLETKFINMKEGGSTDLTLSVGETAVGLLTATQSGIYCFSSDLYTVWETPTTDVRLENQSGTANLMYYTDVSGSFRYYVSLKAGKIYRFRLYYKSTSSTAVGTQTRTFPVSVTPMTVMELPETVSVYKNEIQLFTFTAPYAGTYKFSVKCNASNYGCGLTLYNSDMKALYTHSSTYSYAMTRGQQIYVETEGNATYNGVFTLTCPECAHSCNVFYDKVEPTCQHDGVKAYGVCTNCGVYLQPLSLKTDPWVVLEDLTIPKLDHELVLKEAVQPTCTDYGNIESYECTMCGSHFEKNGEEYTELSQEEWQLDMLPHEWEFHAAVSPTCTEDGSVACNVCVNCGVCCAEDGTILSSTTISALGHSLVRTAAVLPTCTQAGNIAYDTCEICGLHYTVDGEELTDGAWTLEKNGVHHANESKTVCRDCGLTLNWEKSKTFTLPASLDLLKVEALAETAVETVIVTSADANMAADAFNGCDQLRWLVLPADYDITALPQFTGCDNMQIVVLSAQ